MSNYLTEKEKAITEYIDANELIEFLDSQYSKPPIEHRTEYDWTIILAMESVKDYIDVTTPWKLTVEELPPVGRTVIVYNKTFRDITFDRIVIEKGALVWRSNGPLGETAWMPCPSEPLYLWSREGDES